MKAHELARKLLEGPDFPLVFIDNDTGSNEEFEGELELKNDEKYRFYTPKGEVSSEPHIILH
jgi:hypothetical protein